MFKDNTTNVTNTSDIKNINEKLAYELETILIGNTISMLSKRCNLINTQPIDDILNMRLTTTPSRELLRRIANNSNGFVTYKKLYEICGYSEFDDEEDKRWINFIPKRGEIYYIDLGFNIDSEQSGIRPCLIIQNDFGNNKSSTIVIIPITTKSKKFSKTHVKLTKEDGLREDSYILVEQIRCVSKRRIYYNGYANKIAELTSEKMEQIRNAIEFELGLEDLLFNEEKAYILVNHIRALKYNIKTKNSKDLISLYKEKYNMFISYCKKFDKDPELIYSKYKSLDIQYA